jgi:exodeoxyribonuclease VII large subunit
VATQVQGRQAAASVAAAVNQLQTEECDVVVVVRGGGSKGDLATFDAEVVARAIAASDVPVWTGIGHTGDQSVADEVANRAFITPTECGQELARLALDFWRTGMEAGFVAGRLARDQLAVSERLLDRHRHGMVTGARAQLDRHADRVVHRTHTLRGAVRGQVDSHARRLETKGESLARSSVRSLASGQSILDAHRRRLAGLPARRLQAEDLRIAQWQRLLGAYDYRRQLERGYSVTRDDQGRVLRSTAGLTAGSVLHTRLADGQVVSAVTDTATSESVGPDRAAATDEDRSRPPDEGTT